MPSTVKVWNGSSWVSPGYFGKLRMWDGSQWRTVDLTVATGAGQFLTFNPVGGTAASPTYLQSATYDGTSAVVTISASSSVTWNWTQDTAFGTASVSSGSSAAAITFTVNSGPLNDKEATFNVNVGGQFYWTVYLFAATTGDGGGGGFK